MSDPSPANPCPGCGRERKADAKFCGACGQPLDPLPEMEWRTEIPLITNPLVIRDVAVGCSVTVGISWLILLLATGFADGWREPARAFEFAGLMAFGFGGFIAVVSVFTLTVFFGNRCPMEFTLSDSGALVTNTSGRAKAAHRLSWMLAIATGRPLMAGPGLIAQSQEVSAVAWSDITRARFHPAQFAISLRGGIFDLVRLYATPDNYAAVSELVLKKIQLHAPRATVEGTR